MGKCLVTKLHGKVSGDLPYFGALKITVKKTDNITTTTQRRLVLRTADDNCRIFTADGSSKLSDKEDLSNPSSSFVFKNMYMPSSYDNKREIFFLDGDYTVYITSKYNITSLEKWGSAGNYSFDIDELKYSTLIGGLHLVCINMTVDISSLKDLTALTHLELNDSKVIGDISSLKDLTALTHLALENSNVIGDISSLKDLTTLTYLALNDSLKIIGSFESLVSSISAKKTSGSCLYWLSGTNVTYKGERWISGKKFVEFNSDGCNVYDGENNTGNRIASYVKSTNSWSYNN